MSTTHVGSGSVPPAREPFQVHRSHVPQGTALVEASAGTGKTFNIAMSVVRLLLERDARGAPLVRGVGSILVVTFTKAATDELISRIRTVLREAHELFHGRPTSASHATEQLLITVADGRDPDWVRARLTEALAQVDTLAVYTIHRFCKRVLDEFALESGTAFGATLLDDDSDLLQSALHDWWRRRFYVDETLASFAVASSWSPDSFVPAYRLWRRFPQVRLDPDLGYDGARAQLDEAIRQFATVWDEDAFCTMVSDMTWNGDAPCGPAGLATLLRQAAQAVEGDFGAARALADALNTGAVHKAATKKSNRQKAQLAALLAHPVVVAANTVGLAITALEQALRVDCLLAVRAATAAEKRRRNVLAFDDLLEALHTVLAAQGSQGLLARAIRAQFQAALIDEFQDTDRFQFDIFATAFAGCPLFLIGDPKQAIYAFRGADVHAYLAAVRTADPQYTLATNYRSTDAMVQAVNAVFSQRGHAFVDEAIRFEPAVAASNEAPRAILEGSQALHWLFVPPDDSTGKVTGVGTARTLLFGACVRHIATQVNAGWRPGRIAVLVRDRAEGVAVADLLRRHRIPAVVSGLGNVMDSEEMLELQLVLEAVANPRHEGRVRAALATHLWGSDADAVLRLSHPGSEPLWDALQSQLTQLREQWLSHGFLQLVQALVATRAVYERFLSFHDGERRLTNLRHLIELVHAAESSAGLNMEGVLHWLASRRLVNTGTDEVSELRLETDAEAVQVLTIHKSKGLQFDLVYCPTLFSARPVNDSGPLLVHEGDSVVFDHTEPIAPERVRQAEAERLAEDCRLAYVALTRARHRTYAGWGAIGTSTGKVRGAWNSAMAYLLCDDPAVDALPAAERPEAVAQLFRNDVTRYEQALTALVDRHPQIMTLERVDALAGTPTVQSLVATNPGFAARALPANVPLRERFDTYTVSSFTHLAAGSHAVAAEVVRDVDDVREAVGSLEALPPSDFRTFPAGRRAGTALHGLFEHTRFDDSDEVLHTRVAQHLVREGLAADALDPRVQATATMMRAVFDTPLAPWSLRLAQLSPHAARHEWQFLLPFASAGHAYTRQAIARCFEQHGGAAGERYAQQLRRLGSGRVHGYLTGFVDLVFEHEGRWYVVDWKSNQLGADLAAYEPAALQRTMESHHYVLQYHLYLVALHRQLAVRVPGYDYDTHMGGAAYAFLRGFATGASTDGRGWFTDRPSRALIEALSAVMDTTTPAAS